MKSLKITLNSCSYPLFIARDLLTKLDDFCALYRFHETRCLFTDRNLNDEIFQNIHGEKKDQIVRISAQSGKGQFKQLNDIFSRLPWHEQESGITLIVVGEDWLIHLVGFACHLLTVPIHLICFPASFWSMIEMSVNNRVTLNWQDQVSVCSLPYCPDLMLLDVQFYHQSHEDHFFFGLAGVFRHLMMIKPDLFDLFRENLASSDVSDLGDVKLLEEIALARLSLFEEDDGKLWLDDFGVFFLNRFRFAAGKVQSPRQCAILIIFEIYWRWTISRQLDWCTIKEFNTIHTLIHKILSRFDVCQNEWTETQRILSDELRDHVISNLYLPVTIGELKKANEIRFKFANKMLLSCSTILD